MAMGPVSAAAAVDSPWVGTWKLDMAKSNFTGDTVTYSKTPAGLYHISDGSTVSYDFAVDGKEYPTSSGNKTTWTERAVSRSVALGYPGLQRERRRQDGWHGLA